MRKLASIRVAGSITPIAGADVIVNVAVDGWNCVCKKVEFNIGEEGKKGVYFEIDSFLPASDSRFDFLERLRTTFDGNLGVRLRTIRLRGQLSQGLFLPIEMFPELADLEVGTDVTESLGIVKWEAPIPLGLTGKVRGNFPYFIPKTDEERVQNLVQAIDDNKGQEFEVSIKLDGMSMTVYRYDNAVNKLGETFLDHGVCSRNLNITEDDNHVMWVVTKKKKIMEALDFLGRNLAFQGELMGEGIQGNHEKIEGHEFFVYKIFDIDRKTFLSTEEREEIMKTLMDNGFDIKHVPIIGTIVLNHSVKEILEMADGPSLNNENREGLVFKRKDGKFSFKAISNWYLERFDR